MIAAAGCYYGGLLALNLMAGGYATLELERRYAWHFWQSELRRKRYAGSLFDTDTDDNLNASLGAHELSSSRWAGRSSILHLPTQKTLPPLPPLAISIAC
jgi:hypothetical protein